jgi:hypothetical protein
MTHVLYKSARIGDTSASKRLCEALKPSGSPMRPSKEPNPPNSPPFFGFPTMKDAVRLPAMTPEHTNRKAAKSSLTTDTYALSVPKYIVEQITRAFVRRRNQFED